MRLGERKPDPFSANINIPVTESLRERLDRHALKLGIRRAEAARRIIETALSPKKA